ncbi:MAG: LacI family transcriptional regulator [Phyllobacteriaceae bacterium]|jgi:LacI family transcriptional regulator|nr:LacI family transcriptional regulator [Phyllobacteriaceae bacterium]
MGKVGLKQVAATLGVDASTVSRALRNDARVKPETRQLVQSTARKLGYRPNSAARALKGGRSGRVAVLLSPPQQRFASPVFLELLATLGKRLHDHEMSLTVFAAWERSEELDIVRNVVEDRLADGIIIGRTKTRDERVAYLREAGFPFVTFGQTEWPDEHSWVEIDYAEAGRQALAAVAEGNPDTVCIISAEQGQRFADNYVEGAREVARAGGLPEPDVRRVEMSEDGGERLALDLLEPGSRAAYCCIQDSVAFGFFRAAAARQVVPGQDFSLFGGQNFPGSEYTSPPLSTFSTQDSFVADLLSTVMIERLGADGAPDLRHHIIKPTPILRASHLLR